MNKTGIPFCSATWNPAVGCTPCSLGCKNCYAATMSERFGLPWGKPVAMPARFGQPQKTRRRECIFVCSMSDVCHEEMPRDVTAAIHRAVRETSHHYLLLTKRPAFMFRRFGDLFGYPHVWVGTTVETQEHLERYSILTAGNPCVSLARVFLSVEPMLGPVRLTDGVRPAWVICGPENGRGKRFFNPAWAQALADDCKAAGIPYFDKRDTGGIRREFPLALAWVPARRREG